MRCWVSLPVDRVILPQVHLGKWIKTLCLKKMKRFFSRTCYQPELLIRGTACLEVSGEVGKLSSCPWRGHTMLLGSGPRQPLPHLTAPGSSQALLFLMTTAPPSDTFPWLRAPLPSTSGCAAPLVPPFYPTSNPPLVRAQQAIPSLLLTPLPLPPRKFRISGRNLRRKRMLNLMTLKKQSSAPLHYLQKPSPGKFMR